MADNQKTIDKKKICLAASAGGHLTQLLIMVQSWSKYEPVYISTSKVAASKLSQLGKTYIVGECNRKTPFKCLAIFFRCLSIIINERPDYVISTGAAPGLFICVAAKLMRAKVVWVDSIANVKKLSMSGMIVRPFADLFLTQWPELRNPAKKIEYYGGLI